MSGEEQEARAPSVRATRRRFLKQGLVGGVLLALGGTGLALFPTREVGAPREALLSLRPERFQVLVAFAARAITVKSADPVKIAHGVDQLLSYATPEARDDVNALLGLFENALAGLLLDLRGLPFTRLTAESQDRVLEAWRSSRVQLRRSGYQALRQLCLVTYYADESSWDAIPYRPPSGLNAMAYPDSKAGTPEWLAERALEGGG
jgi:hypothetical protein